jgi:hypothetical protein
MVLRLFPLISLDLSQIHQNIPITATVFAISTIFPTPLNPRNIKPADPLFLHLILTTTRNSQG